MSRKFTIDDTNFSKGIAICLMIWHHLFWDTSSFGIAFGGVNISQAMGIVSKVCVSIFLILSGYGIYESTKNEFDIKKTYSKHLAKIYVNYWYIIMVSLIIGFLFFRNNLLQMLPQNHPYLGIILSLSGLQYLVGYKGFNPSWWFISVTIVLYLLYPIFRCLLEKYNFKFFLISILFLFAVNIPYIGNTVFWFFPFIFGMYISKNNILSIIYNIFYKNYCFIILFLLFVVFTYTRYILGMTINGYVFDSIYALLIITINFVFLSRIKIISLICVFLGKHSMIMYLVHMFITNYYIGSVTINMINQPVFMFFISLIITIIVALLIEKSQELMGFNNWVKGADNFIYQILC